MADSQVKLTGEPAIGAPPRLTWQTYWPAKVGSYFASYIVRPFLIEISGTSAMRSPSAVSTSSVRLPSAVPVGLPNLSRTCGLKTMSSPASTISLVACTSFLPTSSGKFFDEPCLLTLPTSLIALSPVSGCSRQNRSMNEPVGSALLAMQLILYGDSGACGSGPGRSTRSFGLSL